MRGDEIGKIQSVQAVEDTPGDATEILDADDVWRRRARVTQRKKQQHSDDGVTHSAILRGHPLKFPGTYDLGRRGLQGFLARCRASLVKTLTSA